MKILFDARMYGLEHTGVGRYILNLTKELKNLKTEEHFVILLRKKYFESLKFPKNWTKVLADFRYYTFAEQLRLSRIISNQKADIVHFPHFNTPIFYKGQFIVTIHDMNMHRQGIEATNLPLPIYYLKRIPYRYAFRHAVKSSLKIITPSQVVKNELVNYFSLPREKIKPIFMGLDKQFLALDKRKNVLKKYNIKDDYFIYVGNVYPHKNIKRAIEAVVLLNKSRKKKVLLIIVSARNIFIKRLKNFVNDFGAGKYVKLIGFVPDKDLRLLYKNSIAFIYPSLAEGFGLQGLEAMAAGTLVLASDISVFKEVYGDNALYFNPLKVASMISRMKEVLGLTSNEKEKMVRLGRNSVKKYSWAKAARQTLEVYKSVYKDNY